MPVAIRVGSKKAWFKEPKWSVVTLIFSTVLNGYLVFVTV